MSPKTKPAIWIINKHLLQLTGSLFQLLGSAVAQGIALGYVPVPIPSAHAVLRMKKFLLWMTVVRLMQSLKDNPDFHKLHDQPCYCRLYYQYCSYSTVGI